MLAACLQASLKGLFSHPAQASHLYRKTVWLRPPLGAGLRIGVIRALLIGLWGLAEMSVGQIVGLTSGFERGSSPTLATPETAYPTLGGNPPTQVRLLEREATLGTDGQESPSSSGESSPAPVASESASSPTPVGLESTPTQPSDPPAAEDSSGASPRGNPSADPSSTPADEATTPAGPSPGEEATGDEVGRAEPAQTPPSSAPIAREPAPSNAGDAPPVTSDRPAAAQTSPPNETGPVVLRYRFQPGEIVRWEVVHQARIKTTVGATTQTAESVTRSIKLWRILDAQPDGTVTFEHIVESVDMWQKQTGREEVRYNSTAGQDPPRGFEAIAQSLNVPLATVTMDARGQILKRQRHPVKAPVDTEPLMTILLPEGPVEPGATWTFPYEVELPLENGTLRVVKAAELYKLREVKTGIAVIEVSTKVLSPINDPRLEAKLIQREREGVVRFDIANGRLIRQEIELDRRVVGFSGPASTLQYSSRLTETLLAPRAEAARKPAATTAR